MLLFVVASGAFGPATRNRAYAEDAASFGHNSTGLTGIDELSAPTSPRGTVVSAALHYGLTESVGPYAGVHQRAGARLAVAYTPLSWLSIAGQVVGRLDHHPDDPQGKDTTGTGDPSLLLRAGRVVHAHTALGAAASAWIPGLNAPSLVLRASTFEFRVLHQTYFPKRALNIISNLGFRLDQSAHAAPARDRLRYGDRTALGVSSFHGLPWGLGAVVQLRPRHALFAELSGLLLLSTQSDVLSASPLRISVGTRHFLKKGLEVEGGARASLSPKPSFASTAPFVPFEPRVLFHVAVRWDSVRFADERARLQAEAEELEREPVVAVASVAVHVHGRVLDENHTPLPDCAVVLTAGDNTWEGVTAFDGSFDFSGLPDVGEASLSIRARGYALRTLPLTLIRGTLELPPEVLERTTSEGLLRMAVRSFKSDAVAADIVIRDTRGHAVARARSDVAGHFETTLPPGTYRVTTTAKGYRKQSHTVRVAADEVAIINVDLREARAR